MRNFAEQNNLKLGAVAQPLRVVADRTHDLAGNFRCFGGTGAEECLARLADQAAS